MNATLGLKKFVHLPAIIYNFSTVSADLPNIESGTPKGC